MDGISVMPALELVLHKNYLRIQDQCDSFATTVSKGIHFLINLIGMNEQLDGLGCICP